MQLPSPRALWRRAASLTGAAALVISIPAAATATTTDPNPNALELENAQLSRGAATQGMVLLENRDHALPIAGSGNVALFGVGAYKTVKGGTGSGRVNNRYTVTARQGLEDAGYTITTSDEYWTAMTSAYDAKYGDSTGLVDYSSVEQPLTDSSAQPTAPTDTAVFVLARNSGENADRSAGPGDFELTQTETGDLQTLGRTYRHVVVVLNVGGVVDTSFYDRINSATTDPRGGTALDGLLLMSQAGQESGNALVDVLDGTVDPSGKLTDTWASSYSYYPASATFGAQDGNVDTEPYTEGVYVGYRYFDSFYRSLNRSDPASVVDYPFGYGLSYTTFRLSPGDVHADMDHVSVTTTVTNVGRSYSGKDVVEVFVSAPQSGLDKPYQELQGYAKTAELAPGESQKVTVRFDTTELSSYDEQQAAYVMDRGDYVVRVGDSSRDTHVAARLHLPQRVVTERLHHELDADAPADELRSDPADFYSYPGEKLETARARQITLKAHDFRATDHASSYEQDVPVGADSPYYAIDGSPIASTTAYVDPAQSDWEGTGKPYVPRTGEKVVPIRTDPAATLYDVAQGRTTMRQFVAGLSVAQLADIVEGATAGGSTLQAVGAAGYTTSKYESLGIPGMTLSDGPAGIRITQQIAGNPRTYQWATAWPIGTLLAQTWDRDLVQRVGDAVGKEMREWGATLWLAPGMNIHRDPLNGRNFEYYAEDPLIAGLTAAATTLGVQSNPGVGVTIKHFAGNNQEANRRAESDQVGERALREIELKGFEIAVKAAQPTAVMTSYNKVNGTWSAGNYDLVTDILRGEWGFRGLVMTDWGGNHSEVATMYAGNDLIEPGKNAPRIVSAMRGADPTAYPMRLGDLQRNAMRVLNIVMQSEPFAELARLQGVDGISVAPYSAQFRDLRPFVTASTGPVSRHPGRH